MAFFLGICMVSFGVAGASVIITHESTKSAREELYQWIAGKLKRQSPDPDNGTGDFSVAFAGGESVVRSDAAVEGDAAADLVPFHAEQVNLDAPVLLDSTVRCYTTVEPSEPAAGGDVDVVPIGGATSLQGDAAITGDPTEGSHMAVEKKDPLIREAPEHDTRGAVIAAVNAVGFQLQGESEGAAVSSDLTELPHVALEEKPPEPDPAPSWSRGIRRAVTAAVNGVRAWGRELFQWVTGEFSGRPPDDRAGKGDGESRAEGPTGWTRDPVVWENILRLSAKILGLALDTVIVHFLKQNRGALKVYRTVKSELKFLTVRVLFMFFG